jgi:pSer/pThr/pTyr-binding forkhead associated (FHA) protein
VLEPSVRKGAAYAIEGEMIIGRSPDSTIVLPDDTFASSMHARVWAVDGEVWVEDLGSTNGTTLNGVPLRNATRLGKGDRVQIGNTLFEAD